MPAKQKLIAQNPLILRCHRLMEAFAKSDDERDFYLDRQEGFLIFVDLDKTQEELDELAKELKDSADRYCPIPKLTFYEIKKVMEGFVNEKVYDIDTKEKLLDIIQSKEARENFLEFIYDHHTELEKWQQYYQERFRVRIIEWLRNNQFDFVFEEDLEMTKSIVEKLKMSLFMPKVQKDLATQRKNLVMKAKTYYSSEALNPRPKRGRPPKQVAKVETEPQFSQDIYTTVPKLAKPFLFVPDYHGASAIFTFSGKFASEADLLAHRRAALAGSVNMDMQNLQQKLAALRALSTAWNVPTEVELPEQNVGPFALDDDNVAFALNGLEPKPSLEAKSARQKPIQELGKQAQPPVAKAGLAKSSLPKQSKSEASASKSLKKEQPRQVSRLVATKPVTSESVTSKSVTSKSVTSKPVTSKSVTSKPVTSKSITSKPAVTSKPVTSKSVASKLVRPALKAPVIKAGGVKKQAIDTKGRTKARLRPLPKKASPPPAPTKDKSVDKNKRSSLRKLRRAKR